MEELRLSYPYSGVLQDWEKDARETFGEQNILGRLDTNFLLQTASGTYDVSADNYNRLDPYLDDLRVFAIVENLSRQDSIELRTSDEFLNVQQRLIENVDFPRELSSYFEKLYKEAPGDVSYEFYSSDLIVDNLESNSEMVEKLEQAIVDDQEFVLTGVSLVGGTLEDDIDDALEVFESSLSFYIRFKYSGNDEAVREYNDIDIFRDTETDHSGVEGMIKVDGDPRVSLLYDDEHCLNDS